MVSAIRGLRTITSCLVGIEAKKRKQKKKTSQSYKTYEDLELSNETESIRVNNFIHIPMCFLTEEIKILIL